MSATPRTPVSVLALGLCLLAVSTSVRAVPPIVPQSAQKPPSATPAYDYHEACDKLTRLGFWVSFNVWNEHNGPYRKDNKRRMAAARREALAVPGMDPRYVRSIEGSAGSSFGSDGTSVNENSFQSALDNALLTATGMHDECIENKGLWMHPNWR